MADPDFSHLTPSVIDIAHDAGKLILDIYQHQDYQSFIKGDNTPVTTADLAAHKLILERLTKLTPDIPVLSEEDADIDLAQRSQWQQYWLVDPLDGTQEFIARSGDFATIIALISENTPIMGVVYSPVLGITYYAYRGQGAWKHLEMNESVPLNTRKQPQPVKSLSFAVSRRQSQQVLAQYLSNQWDYTMLPLGSAALKACMVAEGNADGYLRIGPTGEWDTAAIQCIVNEAGGAILNINLEPLSYNQKESLENPNFVVIGDSQLPWRDILKIGQDATKISSRDQ